MREEKYPEGFELALLRVLVLLVVLGGGIFMYLDFRETGFIELDTHRFKATLNYFQSVLFFFIGITFAAYLCASLVESVSESTQSHSFTKLTLYLMEFVGVIFFLSLFIG